jgi:hypothetical protein
MFRRLLDRIKEAWRSEPVQPPEYDDPLAGQIAWSPVKSGGTNFCTHRLKQTGPQRWKFRPTLGARLFGLVFLAFGVGAAVVGVSVAMERGVSVFGVLFPTLFALIFGGVGLGLLWSLSRSVVLDAQLGWVWVRAKSPEAALPATIEADPDHYVRTDDIHALQIVAEYCQSNESSYYSYELNIVRHDGTRVNLVDHGNKRKILEDADRLAEALRVPVWSARD